MLPRGLAARHCSSARLSSRLALAGRETKRRGGGRREEEEEEEESGLVA
jgi:hypothetical protein